MESLIDNLFGILLILLLINQLWQIAKLVGQYHSRWNSCASWMFLVYAAIGLLAATQLNQVFDFYRISHLIKYQRGLIGLAIFCALSIIALAITKEITPKKVKTLWRLPIIGLLVGLLLKENQLLALWSITELFIWIILLNRRSEHPLIFRNNVKSMLALLVFLCLWVFVIEKKWLLMVIFCVYYYYRITLLRIVLIRQWMDKNGYKGFEVNAKINHR
jgi:hypothetical protein